jgi:opacity protein-like surface antigen
MKKISVLAAAVFVLCFSALSYAQGGARTGAYLGLGGNLGLENFDKDDLRDTLKPLLEPYGVKNINFDHSWGANGKVGYHFQPWLALEFRVDYLKEFQSKKNNPVDVNLKVEITTYMVNVRFVDKFYSVLPYLIGGLGYMRADTDGKVLTPDFAGSTSENYDGACGQVGAGIEYLFTPHFSVGTEITYVWGFGDVDDFRYGNWNILGFRYHF